MATTHTAAPWHLSTDYYGNRLIHGAKSQEGVSLCIARLANAGEETDANQQLLLAAPKMLAALKVAADLFADETMHAEEKMMRDAIAEATGG